MRVPIKPERKWIQLNKLIILERARFRAQQTEPKDLYWVKETITAASDLKETNHQPPAGAEEKYSASIFKRIFPFCFSRTVSFPQK